jgi:hypothetical protein
MIVKKPRFFARRSGTMTGIAAQLPTTSRATEPREGLSSRREAARRRPAPPPVERTLPERGSAADRRGTRRGTDVRDEACAGLAKPNGVRVENLAPVGENPRGGRIRPRSPRERRRSRRRRGRRAHGGLGPRKHPRLGRAPREAPTDEQLAPVQQGRLAAAQALGETFMRMCKISLRRPCGARSLRQPRGAKAFSAQAADVSPRLPWSARRHEEPGPPGGPGTGWPRRSPSGPAWWWSERRGRDDVGAVLLARAKRRPARRCRSSTSSLRRQERRDVFPMS